MAPIQTHNPKAPHPRRVVIRATVPAERLKRLGATQPALDAYRAWWEALDRDGQTVAAAQLGIMTDGQLREQIAAVTDIAGWTSKEVTGWARSQDNRRLAAELAAYAEQLRDEPRAGLLRELETIR